MLNPFDLLGVAETAGDDAIKRAYLQRVREHPPERDPDRFQAIRAAYETIKTHRDRLRHRLFHQQTPDLAELVATTLRPGDSRRRPAETQIRQLLNQRLTGLK
ncbi:MAG: J domain-containing protein [Candidatus Contendobacter sp.]|nr:J domain-containing protein [Candidatus Contendobacter sp.]MDG4556260.1 J domain-containing protein [Candidatus Contendobacter sp.]